MPTAKISTNSTLAANKPLWIDFNAGRAAEGASIQEVGQELYDYVIKVAEGELVAAEKSGFHDLAIFKNGVTL